MRDHRTGLAAHWIEGEFQGSRATRLCQPRSCFHENCAGAAMHPPLVWFGDAGKLRSCSRDRYFVNRLSAAGLSSGHPTDSSSPVGPSRRQRPPGCPRPDTGPTTRSWAQAEHDRRAARRTGVPHCRKPTQRRPRPRTACRRLSPWTCTYASRWDLPVSRSLRSAIVIAPSPLLTRTVCRIATFRGCPSRRGA